MLEAVGGFVDFGVVRRAVVGCELIFLPGHVFGKERGCVDVRTMESRNCSARERQTQRHGSNLTRLAFGNTSKSARRGWRPLAASFGTIASSSATCRARQSRSRYERMWAAFGTML
jgi:hypothetical protein